MAKEDLAKAGYSDEIIAEASGYAQTDNQEILEARALFREKKSRVLEMIHETSGYTASKTMGAGGRKKSLQELFTDFFFDRSGEQLPDELQTDIIKYVAEHAGRAGDLGEGLVPDEKQTKDLVKFILGQEEKG
jgi:hypothetical protein